MLGRLGVFAGGFDLPAAEQVCGAEPLQPEDILDVLGSLVEKSLVMLDERDEGTRYRMLETIRDYAREKEEQGGNAVDTQTRHCNHYFAMAKEANRGLQGLAAGRMGAARRDRARQPARRDDVLAVGRRRSVHRGQVRASRCCGFWILRGYSTEGRAMVRAALAMPEIQASDLAQAHALYVGAALAECQSDYGEAKQMLETCLTLRRRLGNPVDIAATLSTLALARLSIGDWASAREERVRGARDLPLADRPVRRGDRACCTSARSRCTSTTTRAPSSTSKPASRSRARSRTRKSKASASACSARSPSKPATSRMRASG